MRRFVKKIIYHFLILLITALLLDFIISSRLKIHDQFAYGESYIWNEIYQGKVNRDILIYGSSRAWVHFDPKIIQDSLRMSTYNLGIDGHNFWLQYFRHKALIKNNVKPKVIILSVGIFTLNRRSDLYNMNQFLPYIYYEDVYHYTSVYKGFTIFDYILPLYRYIGKRDVLRQAFYYNKGRQSKQENYRIDGFRGMNREWNHDLENAKQKLASFTLNMHEPSIKLMELFFEECNDLGIEVVMVYSPEYIEGQYFVENRSEIMETFSNLSETYNFHFLDYSNDEISKDKILFYNSMHLNAIGAERFTTKFVSDLKQNKILTFKGQ